MPMSEATKRKLSESQKGKRRGPRGPHGAAILNLDFDVERAKNGGVKVSIYNDVGGADLADFTTSPAKARRLGDALIRAAGGPDEPTAIFLIVEKYLDFEGYSKSERTVGFATTREAAQAYIDGIKPSFSAQTGAWINKDGTRAPSPDERIRSVQEVGPVYDDGMDDRERAETGALAGDRPENVSRKFKG